MLSYDQMLLLAIVPVVNIYYVAAIKSPLSSCCLEDFLKKFNVSILAIQLIVVENMQNCKNVHGFYVSSLIPLY
jgi:hypothetical protein